MEATERTENTNQQIARLLAAAVDPALAAAAWRMLASARRLVLLAHEHPDPDALGSALGLAHALTPLGKECVVACADPVPANYDFLPGREAVRQTLPEEESDLIVALDAGELARYGVLYTANQARFAATPILNIDHHITSRGCGQVSLIDPASAATAELLTLLLLHWGVAVPRASAECLLAGILTDTRGFEFEATTERTLLAGAYLVGRGAVPEAILRPMYRLKPLAKARLWGRVLASVQSAAQGQIVWGVLRRSDLAAADAAPEMDDGLPSYLMDTEGVALALLFREQADGSVRVSVRSRAPVDAAALCAQFGGGGHVRAAGCALALPVEEAVAQVVAAAVAAVGASTPEPTVQ